MIDAGYFLRYPKVRTYIYESSCSLECMSDTLLATLLATTTMKEESTQSFCILRVRQHNNAK